MTAFVPGYPPPPQRFLARFLPPLAEGIAAHYLQLLTQPGQLILDPFGQSPRVAVEALHLNRRVIVASFNPISRLALSLAVRPPDEIELRRALTLIGDAPKDADRMEHYLKGLYRTLCRDCGAAATADAFEWEGETLTALTYACHQCGRPPRSVAPTDGDRQLAARYTRASLDYHFLLNRVAPPGDADREPAQEALAVYPPRALAALAAVINKLEALDPPPGARRLVLALIVAACDAAAVLGPDRPRVLSTPKRWVEVNVWLAMERGISLLAGRPAPDRSVPLADLLNAQSGISAHNGPVRDLAEHLPPGGCALIITALPRPNQAYWTLSAVWSAWLWGRDSASALRATLRRRRYDWAWHAHALRRAFESSRPALAPDGRMIGLMAEAEPGFVACGLAAADLAGFELKGAALRADTAEAQFDWSLASMPPPSVPGKMLEAAVQAAARESAVEVLKQRGEPSRWAVAHLGAWQRLAQERYLAAHAEEDFNRLARLVEAALRDAPTLARYGAEADDEPATGRWYVAEAAGRADVPLADKIEMEVLRRLSAAGPLPVAEMDLQRAICGVFPGARTPGLNTVVAALRSYAQPAEAGAWQLRAEDVVDTRLADMESIQAQLRALGVRHGFGVQAGNPQVWLDDEQPLYLFAVMTTAAFSRFVFEGGPRARRRFLVMPGGRAGLAAHKLRRDPRLRAAFDQDNWLILKFRQVRQMVNDPHLTRATLEPAFDADPVEEFKQLGLPTLL